MSGRSIFGDEVQVEKNEILGKLVRLDDVIRLYPRKRKFAQPTFDYLEQLYLYMDYYVPDEKERRHPFYNREDRRPLIPSAVAPNARRTC